MTIWQLISLFSSLLGIISFCINIIQYKERRSLKERMKSFAEGTYMDHFMIARACTRAATYDLNIESIGRINRELHYINGIADAARNNVISVSEVQLGFTPYFKHPAFPEKNDINDEIRLGKFPTS